MLHVHVWNIYTYIGVNFWRVWNVGKCSMRGALRMFWVCLKRITCWSHFNRSPNSASTLRGSYGRRKGWCLIRVPTLEHLSRKFQYKVALVKCWSVFRLRRLAQSVVLGSGLEILYRDLARRPLLQILCGDLARAPRHCTEICCREIS